MQNNQAGQIPILKSALQELMIQIGDALMPTIRNIVSHIQSFVEKLQQMDEGTRNTIIRIAALRQPSGLSCWWSENGQPASVRGCRRFPRWAKGS